MLIPFLVEAADIRFYRINKQDQQARITLLGGATAPGCHNFPHRPRVHRIGVIGFKQCSVYTAKDCAAASLAKTRWKDNPEKKNHMTPGARWFLPGDRGSKLASWRCLAK